MLKCSPSEEMRLPRYRSDHRYGRDIPWIDGWKQSSHYVRQEMDCAVLWLIVICWNSTSLGYYAYSSIY